MGNYQELSTPAQRQGLEIMEADFELHYSVASDKGE